MHDSSPTSNRKIVQAIRHRMILITIISALGGLVLGVDSGAISGAVLFLKSAFHISIFQSELMVSALVIGAMVGSALAGRSADKFGRRTVLAASSLLVAVFGVGTALAPTYSVMLTFRLLSGVAVGVIVVVGPIFASEFAPSQARGKMVGAFQLAVAVGLELAYWMNVVFGKQTVWRDMFLWIVVPSVTLFGSLLFVPDTPRWYFIRGAERQGERALTWMFGSTEVKNKETQRIKEEIDKTKYLSQEKWTALLKPNVRQALIFGIGFAVIEQLTGIKSVTYYGPMIFTFADFSKSQALVVTAWIGILTVCATIAGLMLIDRWGRRPLILTSLVGMALSMMALGVAFALGKGIVSLPVLTVGSIMLFHLSYSIGIGIMGWVLLPEIFPNRLRGRSQSVTKVVNWIAGLAVSLGFLSLSHAAGPSVTFFIFALVVVAGLIFTYRLTPETKGRPLETAETLWRNGSF